MKIVAVGPASNHVRRIVTSFPASYPISPPVFRVCWVLIIVYHTINIVLLGVLALTHIYTMMLTVHGNTWLIGIAPSILLAAGCSMAVIVGGHMVVLSSQLWQSMKRRRLFLASTRSIHQNTPRRWPTCTLGICSNTHRSGSCAPTLTRWFRSLIVRCRQLIDVFDLHSRHFYGAFYARQAVEIVFQTYQVYQVSQSTPHRWFARFVVALVVTNCVFVPCLHQLLRNQPVSRRIALLTADLVLDFVAMAIVPVIVILPYLWQLDRHTGRYNDTYIFDDVWAASFLLEVRQLLVSSVVDLVSTLMPCVTGFLTLDRIKNVIQQSSFVRRSITDGRSTNMLRMAPHSSMSRRSFYLFSALWCVGLCAIHVHSEHRVSSSASVNGCTLPVHTWFGSRAPCSIVHVNCFRQSFAGSAQELAGVFELVDPQSVTRIILSHCTSIRVPPLVIKFVNLQSFHTFNSTVVEWPAEASLTQRHTPRVNQLNFISTNFTGFPQGIVHSDLPLHLGLLVHRSNLSEIPNRFGDVWSTHSWPVFSIEFTQLESIPPTISSIRCQRLSLVGSSPVQLKDLSLGSSTMVSLRISHTNLTSIPVLDGGTEHLYHILAENTKIKVLPSWFTTWFRGRQDRGLPVFVSFRGSPVCTTGVVLGDVCQTMSPEKTGDFNYDVTAQHRPL